MPKYDSMRKLNRNKMVRDAVALRPDLSLAEIGRLFADKDNPEGISASRVSRISGGIRKRKETG